MPSRNNHYEFLDTGYGKSFVKLLHIRRDGPRHEIREYEVSTQLSLDSKKDYLYGDNEDIVATDSQKNTVYLMAKNHGVTSPEQFGILLCNHFMSKYPQVLKARVRIDAHPWQRVVVDGKEHNHAFVAAPVNTRFSIITQVRGAMPKVQTGLRDLQLLKTTQSSFVNFVSDEFRSLPDMDDRIFSTVVYCRWEYFTTDGLDFEKAWDTIVNAIIENFAGPAERGTFSPSVQNTIYLTQKDIMSKIPQVSNVEMTMPNKHYYPVDLSKFPKLGSPVNKEVFLPSDKPSGLIRCVLGRKGAKL